MRWDGLRIQPDEPTEAPTNTADDEGGTAPPEPVALPLALSSVPGARIRTFDTPEFRGMTFYEVRSRSVLNRVPTASQMPFRWTVNPYRGCSHACVYCFARNTHTYLDLDAGHDFDSQVVVKVNAGEALRHDLAAPTWRREHVAMGTNVDCYQRAEGRYQLMPGIISALRDFGTPFSILTKGTLILRDLPALTAADDDVSVGLNFSVGSIDRELWRAVEPGTPAPQARLRAVRQIRDAGLSCGVLMGPVIPYLSDSPEQLDAAIRSIAEAGATHVAAIALHLRPGAREWFMSWLGREHPELVPKYHRLYQGGSYAPASYRRTLSELVASLARRHGIGDPRTGGGRWLGDTAEAHAPGSEGNREEAATQLSLI